MCLTSTETIRLITNIRDGEKGRKGVWRWGEREIIYLSLHCHHQNDSCITMGSDESHFNVSVGSDGQSQDSVHKPQPFWRERRAKAESNQGPSAYQPNALPLGQTGSVTDNHLSLSNACTFYNDICVSGADRKHRSTVSLGLLRPVGVDHGLDSALWLGTKSPNVQVWLSEPSILLHQANPI